MRFIKRCSRAVRHLFKRRRLERQMDEEFESYLALMTEAKMRDGTPAGEAARQARAEFGSALRIKQSVREVRSEFMFDATWQDIRYAFRILQKHRGFTAIAVVTIAIGISSVVTAVTVVNALLADAQNEPIRRYGQHKLRSVAENRRSITVFAVSLPYFPFQ